MALSLFRILYLIGNVFLLAYSALACAFSSNGYSPEDLSSEEQVQTYALTDTAFEFIAPNGGLEKEEDYRYLMEEGNCEWKRVLHL